ncbi:YraN family protein [Thiohalophilus sp.]|uniref:YraN family protein n=1 Tax=Thiohalophilus sp. TaxID=3028392 RepID=UPI0039748A4A
MWSGPGRAQRGNQAEQWARRYLEQQGLHFEQANFRCRRGEIDLIMRDGDSLVFVEVRYRRNDRYGSAAETVDRQKQRKLVTTALFYLQNNPKQARLSSRFDVVAISGEGDAPRIDWHPDAIQIQD